MDVVRNDPDTYAARTVGEYGSRPGIMLAVPAVERKGKAIMMALEQHTGGQAASGTRCRAPRKLKHAARGAWTWWLLAPLKRERYTEAIRTRTLRGGRDRICGRLWRAVESTRDYGQLGGRKPSG